MSTPTDRPAPSIVTRLVAVNAVTVVGLILLLLLTPATITYPARPVEVLWVAMATVAVLVPSEWLLVRTLQDERRRAAAAVIGSEEATRRRIGNDLHDQVGQDLTYALLRLGDLERRVPPEHADAVRAAGDALRETVTRVRDLAADLRPAVLEDLGLEAALEGLAQVAHRPGPDAVVRLGDLSGLDAAQELAAYRVAQEAITNVVRHAGATRLELAAGRRGHAVELTVTDDGHGGVRNQGFGITGMRERALAAGGRLEIDSDAGGTTVRLVLPVALERGGPRP